ncbi:hypothetical protein ACFOOK_15995 [Micromonospora krabiensis]|uniref:DUF1579 domain-containing protein n=1 Tax=Micromonospora krabiensis TaxID=307121 RepID=A0A1C3N0H4_9ACTN|nr:hypothetical protein [Micromonospora krabiensis]SBV26055.1 hypothetical protein GA0070620_1537 [Micromonospora krabiensis]
MTERHPALARLDVLVGRWTVQPEVDGLGTGWTEFSWVEGGAFLRQFSDAEPLPPDAPQAWRENNPLPVTALIGLDDAGEEFTMLYADARGVHRVYRMAFADGVWRLERNAPGFHQRFTGELSPDRGTVHGRWEGSPDGVDWRLDFAITYRR